MPAVFLLSIPVVLMTQTPAIADAMWLSIFVLQAIGRRHVAKRRARSA